MCASCDSLGSPAGAHGGSCSIIPVPFRNQSLFSRAPAVRPTVKDVAEPVPIAAASALLATVQRFFSPVAGVGVGPSCIRPMPNEDEDEDGLGRLSTSSSIAFAFPTFPPP